MKEKVTRNSGKILQLGSVDSFMPNLLQAIYAATKAFVLSFSEAFQNELKETKVTVTVLCPPATDTDSLEVAGGENTLVAQGDMADPENVAKEGYKGLMNGDARVLPTMSAKMHFAQSALFPGSMLAELLKMQIQEVK